MDKKQPFLNEVKSQIKSKEAQKYVADELGYHLKEAKNRWLEKGLTEEEAEEKAVAQMGSPVKLGQELNKLHRPKVDWLLLVLLAATLLLGFLPLISLGYMDEKYFTISKTVSVLLGGAAAIGVMLVDYRKWKNWGWLFYAVGILILVMLKFFVSTMVNGVPILRISLVRIESTMAIPFLFLAWASFFNNKRLRVWQFGILFVIPFLLFLWQPSISNTYIYTIMVFAMLWVSRFSRKTMVILTTSTAGAFLILSYLSWDFLRIFQKERILAFWHPEQYPNGAGYFFLRMKEMRAKAGWLGNAGQKEFIPEGHTDFVFVSFTYYYGWLFAIALALVLGLLAVRIVMVTFKIKDSYGKLLLTGALTLYLVQLMTNIAVALGLLPIISMSLPFISYGLMPTVLNAVLIGVVLSVYRRKDLVLSHK